MNVFTLPFNEWVTVRWLVDTGTECQTDVPSTVKLIFSKYRLAGHQTEVNWNETRGKTDNVVGFDNLNVRELHVEIHGVKYPNYPEEIMMLSISTMTTF